MNWKQTQENADRILQSGLISLKKSSVRHYSDVLFSSPGNYLIEGDKHSYIGEAKNLDKRLMQQFRPKSSTFYKNYLKVADKPVSIDQFKVRRIETRIGRKEMEEFGIVNIPTTLNKFQLDKRTKFSEKESKLLFQEVQENSLALLKAGDASLKKVKLQGWTEANILKMPGIYWVEHDKYGLIYLGESSELASRINTHSKQTYFSALRRHIGENLLGFELKTQNGKERYFSEKEDDMVSKTLYSSKIRILPVPYGRYELEEYLIKKYKPVLNRKDNL